LEGADLPKTVEGTIVGSKIIPVVPVRDFLMKFLLFIEVYT
jgi:hypothetical protein